MSSFAWDIVKFLSGSRLGEFGHLVSTIGWPIYFVHPVGWLIIYIYVILPITLYMVIIKGFVGVGRQIIKHLTNHSKVTRNNKITMMSVEPFY
jgi:hypothetical protein